MLWVSSPVFAFEFVSVATPVILYDAPSLKAKKLFVATRYYPLEKIVSLDNWVKVRDSDGKLFWIEKRALSAKRFVVVNAPVAAVHEKPDTASVVVFHAAQHVALEWLGDTGSGWLKIGHLDGSMGYVKFSEVWGG